MGHEGSSSSHKPGYARDSNYSLVRKGNSSAGRHLASPESKSRLIYSVPGAHGGLNPERLRIPSITAGCRGMRICRRSGGGLVWGDAHSKPGDNDGVVSSRRSISASSIRPVSIIPSNRGSPIAPAYRTVDCRRSILYLLFDLLLYE